MPGLTPPVRSRGTSAAEAEQERKLHGHARAKPGVAQPLVDPIGLDEEPLGDVELTPAGAPEQRDSGRM